MNIGDRIVERYEGRTATASHGIVRIVHIIKSINEVDRTCECELVEDDRQLMLTTGRIETLGFDYVNKHLNK